MLVDALDRLQKGLDVWRRLPEWKDHAPPDPPGSIAVGQGARPFANGIDAVYYVAQKNYPVEFAEMEFGVRIEGYSMHTDSGPLSSPCSVSMITR